VNASERKREKERTSVYHISTEFVVVVVVIIICSVGIRNRASFFSSRFCICVGHNRFLICSGIISIFFFYPIITIQLFLPKKYFILT